MIPPHDRPPIRRRRANEKNADRRIRRIPHKEIPARPAGPAPVPPGSRTIYRQTTYLEDDSSTSEVGSSGGAMAVTQPLWPLSSPRSVNVSAILYVCMYICTDDLYSRIEYEVRGGDDKAGLT